MFHSLEPYIKVTIESGYSRCHGRAPTPRSDVCSLYRSQSRGEQRARRTMHKSVGKEYGISQRRSAARTPPTCSGISKHACVSTLVSCRRARQKFRRRRAPAHVQEAIHGRLPPSKKSIAMACARARPESSPQGCSPQVDHGQLVGDVGAPPKLTRTSCLRAARHVLHARRRLGRRDELGHEVGRHRRVVHVDDGDLAARDAGMEAYGPPRRWW